MEIRYSKHLLTRLRIREIPETLPRLIMVKARRRFFDTETDLEIAVARAKFAGKLREVMVAYRRDGDDMLLITIHPLKLHQLKNRIASGRWKPIRKS